MPLPTYFRPHGNAYDDACRACTLFRLRNAALAADTHGRFSKTSNESAKKRIDRDIAALRPLLDIGVFIPVRLALMWVNSNFGLADCAPPRLDILEHLLGLFPKHDLYDVQVEVEYRDIGVCWKVTGRTAKRDGDYFTFICPIGLLFPFDCTLKRHHEEELVWSEGLHVSESDGKDLKAANAKLRKFIRLGLRS